MKIGSLFTDERAVSPVIAVILMVAITVILAAVIGAFVLDITASEEAAPQVSIDFTYDDDGSPNELRLALSGTATKEITASELGLNGANLGATVDSGDTLADVSGDYGPSSRIRAGDGYTISDAPSDIQLNVVWLDDNGKEAAILGEFDGPDA
jgi:flagellin-like protein